MGNHSVALWLTSGAPGAQVVDEVSDEDIMAYLDGASKWAYGDVVLGAAIATMYRCRVPSAFAAAVQVNGEGTLQYRYRIDLSRAPSEMSKRRGMIVEQALLVALQRRCQIAECHEQCVRPCVLVYQAGERITMHINAASVAQLDEETLIRLLTDPVADDERVAGYRFCW